MLKIIKMNNNNSLIVPQGRQVHNRRWSEAQPAGKNDRNTIKSRRDGIIYPNRNAETHN
jgi:hypothetical protein